MARPSGSSVRFSLVRAATALALATLALAGCAGQATNDTFTLSAMPAVEGRAAKGRQLLVPEPSALKALDSEQIVVRLSGAELQYLAQSQWSDRLPRMVQSKLVQAFEASGRLGGVGKPGEGLAIDYQLLTDIRAFEVSTAGPQRAIVEISAKLLNDRNGTIVAQKAFRAEIPVAGSGNKAFVAGLDKAFATVAAQIVSWSLGVI
ncbi:cholesterol transport system auxiliary component [Rhizobium sp. RU20A]|uniref:ABC-type transport auxiliary lipoprotein family protein n=1 Tax=Rhizobium sp. RU20A TaxID=1907412 RepID=UPI0009570272|nr:ABC-type transport auxiliary lipoprotein family protein [Rhizobium sp. RU20A]SIQ09547.1 cholesterol transport system auxiliary component [Rhizobium sp. RU20A]